MFKKMRTAALGAAIALAPAASYAATITVVDLTPGVDPAFVVADTGVLTGAVAAGSFASSGMSFTIVATPIEQPSKSVLNTISVTTSGKGKIGIWVSEDDFGAGAGSPTNVKFDVTATSVGFSLAADAYVDDGNVLYATTVAVGPTITFSTPFTGGLEGHQVTTSTTLSSPFSMTSYFVVEHDDATDITSFDATEVAGVPVPAAGLMLLTALGGLGLARRRRKAA